MLKKPTGLKPSHNSTLIVSVLRCCDDFHQLETWRNQPCFVASKKGYDFSKLLLNGNQKIFGTSHYRTIVREFLFLKKTPFRLLFLLTKNFGGFPIGHHRLNVAPHHVVEYNKTNKAEVMLMEEILHQLMSSLYHPVVDFSPNSLLLRFLMQAELNGLLHFAISNRNVRNYAVIGRSSTIRPRFMRSLKVCPCLHPEAKYLKILPTRGWCRTDRLCRICFGGRCPRLGKRARLGPKHGRWKGWMRVVGVNTPSGCSGAVLSIVHRPIFRHGQTKSTDDPSYKKKDALPAGDQANSTAGRYKQGHRMFLFPCSDGGISWQSVVWHPHLWAKLLLQEALPCAWLSCQGWLWLPLFRGWGTECSCGLRTSEVDPN